VTKPLTRFFQTGKAVRVKTLPTTLLALGACLALHSALAAEDKGAGKLTIEIPAEVQATIDKEKADGRVHDFKRVNESDGTTYIVGLIIDGSHYALQLDAGGRVMRKEIDEVEPEGKPATLETVPAAVKKTLVRESRGVEIKEIEVTDAKKTYSVEVTYEGRKFQIDVDATGKLRRKEQIQDAD